MYVRLGAWLAFSSSHDGGWWENAMEARPGGGKENSRRSPKVSEKTPGSWWEYY